MADTASPFNAKTVLWIIVAGLIAFAGFLVLTAYAPEWRTTSDGRPTVLSKSAVGYSALFAIERAVHGNAVTRVTDRSQWQTPGLLIVTLSAQTNRDALKKLVAARQSVGGEAASTLYILPKWMTLPDVKHRGWVMKGPAITTSDLQELVGAIGDVRVMDDDRRPNVRLHDDVEDTDLDVAAPEMMPWLQGNVVSVISDGAGHAVLARVNKDGPDAYVLADPDLMSNHGMKNLNNAQLAVQIIDWLRYAGDAPIAFDDMTATAGGNRNLLRLMFEPPFLAFTLALLMAALLTGVHAVARFGPPAIEGRAIPFGKRALADNAALLIARAKREAALGDRYVAVIRDAAGTALGAATLAPDDLERWLGRLPGGFEELAYAARNAPDAVTMRNAAAALHAWKKDVTRDH